MRRSRNPNTAVADDSVNRLRSSATFGPLPRNSAIHSSWARKAGSYPISVVDRPPEARRSRSSTTSKPALMELHPSCAPTRPPRKVNRILVPGTRACPSTLWERNTLASSWSPTSVVSVPQATPNATNTRAEQAPETKRQQRANPVHLRAALRQAPKRSAALAKVRHDRIGNRSSPRDKEATKGLPSTYTLARRRHAA